MPSQSWAPTTTSGPLPVGACCTNWSRISPNSFCTSETFTPVSSVNSAAASFMTSARSASTQTVIWPENSALSPDASSDGVDEQPARTSADVAAMAPNARMLLLVTFIGACLSRCGSLQYASAYSMHRRNADAQ